MRLVQVASNRHVNPMHIVDMWGERYDDPEFPLVTKLRMVNSVEVITWLVPLDEAVAQVNRDLNPPTRPTPPTGVR